MDASRLDLSARVLAVADVAEALSAERPYRAALDSDAGAGEVINLGSNFEISIADTATLIADVMGVELATESDAVRLRPEKSEVERLWADNRKARELLGWEPAYAGRDGLRRGLSETVAWFRDPENLRRYKTGAYTL